MISNNKLYWEKEFMYIFIERKALIIEIIIYAFMSIKIYMN